MSKSAKVLSATRRRWCAAAWLLGIACTVHPAAAQQAAPQAPAAGTQPSPAAAPSADKLSDKPAVPKTAEEARAALRAAEAAHPGNSPEIVSALVALINVEIELSRLNDDSLAEANRAVTIAGAAEGKDSSLYANALASKSRVVLLLDHPEDARPMAEDALAIEQRLGNDPAALADAAEAVSYVCQRMRDRPCALRADELEVKTLRAMKDVDQGALAGALIDLMAVRRQNDDMEGAKAALAEVMAIAEHSETVDSNWQIIENNAGGFYIALGDYPRALEHLKKGLEFSAQIDGPANLSQSSEVANLAYLEMCLGHGDEALKYYARARDLYARRFGAGHSQTALLESGYGFALSMLGNPKQAVDQALAAHVVERERIRMAIRLMPERQAMLMSNAGAESYNLAVSVMLHHPEIETAAVYQEVVRTRALVAEEMAQRQAALNRKSDPDTAALEQKLEDDRKALMWRCGSPRGQRRPPWPRQPPEDGTHRTGSWRSRSAAFRTDERVRSSDLGELRANMPAGSVLVSYVLFAKYTENIADFNKPPEWWYMALVMHRDSDRIGVYDLGDAKSIKDLFQRMRNSAEAEAHSGGVGSTRNEREYRDAATELRKRIWDPFQNELGAAGLVFVVPDGRLGLVPFSALPEGNGYMVEHGPVIHILSSERDLLPGETPQRKAGLLAVGSPSFEMASAQPRAADALRDAPANCDSFNKSSFHALPESLNEVNDLSTSWKRWNGDEPEHLLTGDNATREQFLEAAPRSRILHVATHAFVLDKSCGNGNPLLLSGLVFAGANKSREASILTAQQIASMDLHGVDWAVLSACNTGYGETNAGEGVVGLERAFRVAGAKSVVMSLWPVDDETTREFMRDLYAERFGRRATTADAVWLAARRQLKERQAAGKSTHPWYWAGFIAAGGWQ